MAIGASLARGSRYIRGTCRTECKTASPKAGRFNASQENEAVLISAG